MRYFSTFTTLVLVFLHVSLSDARRGPEEYWKSIMNEKPIPEVLKDLIDQHEAYQSDGRQNLQKYGHSLNMNHFTRDFGTKPNLIIYRSGMNTQVFREDVKLDMTPRWKKNNLKHVKLRLNLPQV